MIQAINISSKGAAVEDVQQRLCDAGYLTEEEIDSDFGEKTMAALQAFCQDNGLDASEGVTDKVWAMLVDASFCMGDRSLYLRMPYFHGHDVQELQQALGALGFACGMCDGIFGAYTELALRKFQTNMGLYADGIAGSQTFMALRHLQHNWQGKEVMQSVRYMGFARASDVLEQHALCLYGVTPFTRDVAHRMSNVAVATNPLSKVVCAEDLLVDPDANMLLVQIVLPEEQTLTDTPRVTFEDGDDFPLRLKGALGTLRRHADKRLAIEIPSYVWEEAGPERSAQHYAISLIDGLCVALAALDD